MLSKEEIESMKIDLWNIRADTLKAMQCSLADTSDKKEWQKEINVIDNALEYIDQLESDNYEQSNIINNYIENSIPKEVIEEKRNELQKEYEEELDENSTKAFILKCKLEMIRELLEGK